MREKKEVYKMKDCSLCKKHISQDGCCDGLNFENCKEYVEEKDGRMKMCDLIISLEQLEQFVPGQKFILQDRFEVDPCKVRETNKSQGTAIVMVLIREKVLDNLMQYVKKRNQFSVIK